MQTNSLALVSKASNNNIIIHSFLYRHKVVNSEAIDK